MQLCLLLAILNTAAGGADFDGVPSKQDLDHFASSVAPILSARCVSCHRPDNLKGKLDLTTREGLLKGGVSGAPVAPGKPDESPLYLRTLSEDGQTPEMPAKGDPLTKAEAEQLRRWIERGAAWPENLSIAEKAKADASFWSFRPIADLPGPDVRDPWALSIVDRFVLAKLNERGLKPNPPASPGVFQRRATFDLTGLPPTPDSLERFAAECRAETGCPETLGPRSVARLVDRLLADPAYGERWGRHWLDAIRFGESRGYERNEIITNLWPFRDYVIKSFNDDKPFDVLIREHLAGDVVGRDDPAVEVGSAFLVAGPYDDVGNQDAAAAARIRSDQMDEMIRASGEAILGLTIGCARCHDHKFDPIATKDYYALSATFAGTVYGSREVTTAEARRRRATALAGPTAERDRLSAEKETLEKRRIERAAKTEAEASKRWVRPRASRYGTEEKFPPIVASQVRIVVDGTDAENGLGRFKLDEFEVWTDGPNPRNVALASTGAKAIGQAPNARDFDGAYGPSLAIDGKFGERWQAAGPDLTVVFPRSETIARVFFSSDRTRSLGEDNGLTLFVGDYRIETSVDGKTWTKVADSSDRTPASRGRKEARLVRLIDDREDEARIAEVAKRIQGKEREIASIPAPPAWWVGTHRKANGPFHVFIGGDPARKGDPVVPAPLSVLAGLKSNYRLKDDGDEGERRLAFANWATAADNPLTPRVLANRVWQHHFGVGIVDTPSDFGYMGGRPTHPELLDRLATELLRGGYRLKSLHRLIMNSNTYQQASTRRAEAAAVDGDSRLLWRFPPRRLSAEELRDAMLGLSGSMNRAMGGPGFKLYEYQQDNVATYVPLDRHGPETYRRAVYHHNARASRVDVLSDFDCPDPAFAEPRRAQTTTAGQALTLLNHAFTLDMAEAFAERLRSEAQSIPDQVDRAFLLAYNRRANDQERSAASSLVAKHGLRALARAILNSNELLMVD